MIPMISASTIYSTLGNNSSLIPLAIKDIANSCGLTTASYMAGDKFEGKDRFIDEFGTQAIWLGGIPTYKFILGKLLCFPKNLDPNIDVRIFKDKGIIEAAKEFAPTKEIQSAIENAAKNKKYLKNITMAKFIASTALTALTYLGLTKFRHKYTENQIKKEYFAQKDEIETCKNISFTGGIQDFMFDPVRNLMIVDGVITGERLTHARNPQDLTGYVIKEGSFWAFMYLAGPMISKALERHSEKYFNKSIDLDARVIESEQLKQSFADGSMAKHLEAFKLADKSNIDMYRFAVNPETDNLVVEIAKKSDIITLYEKSGQVDTRKYIDLSDLRGIANKIEKLFGQYEASGETIDEFFKSVRKLKRLSVIKNMGACIAALGVISPLIMLAIRKFSKDSDYQVKKDVEAKLAQSNNSSTDE
ncbi:hypothetical protein IJ579_05340 [bacterium]|nr:hypothetical protein [bacterium]